MIYWQILCAAGLLMWAAWLLGLDAKARAALAQPKSEPQLPSVDNTAAARYSAQREHKWAETTIATVRRAVEAAREHGLSYTTVQESVYRDFATLILPELRRFSTTLRQDHLIAFGMPVVPEEEVDR